MYSFPLFPLSSHSLFTSLYSIPSISNLSQSYLVFTSLYSIPSISNLSQSYLVSILFTFSNFPLSSHSFSLFTSMYSLPSPPSHSYPNCISLYSLPYISPLSYVFTRYSFLVTLFHLFLLNHTSTFTSLYSVPSIDPLSGS